MHSIASRFFELNVFCSPNCRNDSIICGMGAPAERRLRYYSLILLALAVAMLLSGLSFLEPYLAGWIFVVYWLVCLALTCGVIVVAMLELRAIRRNAQRAHLALFLDSLRDIKPTEPKITDNENNNIHRP